MDATILQILVKHKLPPTIELVEAMQEVFAAGAATAPAEEKETLSTADSHTLLALGINPAKKFMLRNSQFTIVGYKPSRWKFPVSAQTQNGARYKFTIEQVKRHQM